LGLGVGVKIGVGVGVRVRVRDGARDEDRVRLGMRAMVRVRLTLALLVLGACSEGKADGLLRAPPAASSPAARRWAAVITWLGQAQGLGLARVAAVCSAANGPQECPRGCTAVMRYGGEMAGRWRADGGEMLFGAW
jgi:hypothetical protein